MILKNSFNIKPGLKTNIWLEEFTFNLNQLLRQFWKEFHTYCVKSIFELSLGVSCPWSMRCQGSLWRPLFLRFTMGPFIYFFNFFTLQISLLFMVFSKGELIPESISFWFHLQKKLCKILSLFLFMCLVIWHIFLEMEPK